MTQDDFADQTAHTRNEQPSMRTIGMSLLSPPEVASMPFSAGQPDQGLVSAPMLPSTDEILELTELFFEMIHPWAPLFHRPSFGSGLFATGREVLLHGIVVAALRHWNKPDLPADVQEHYLKSSRDRIYLTCADSCNINSTQSLTLLAIDAFSQGPGTKIWMVMAMLAAAVQQLGLAKETPMQAPESSQPLVGNEVTDSNAEASSIAAEERRRLFWVIFKLDRFASVSLGQPGAINTRSIKLRTPSEDGNWYQSSVADWFQASAPLRATPSTDPWRHYIDLLTLLDRSNRLLIHPFDLSLPAHCQEWQSHFRMQHAALANWFETCPAQCRIPLTEFDAMWIIVRATFEL